jgi:hypothetical protein
MIEVKRRAQLRADRSGDPLDGLVNMFDVGIVLAVAFLIAALQSLHLTQVLTKRSTVGSPPHSIVVGRNQRLVPVKPGARRVAITGAGRVGSVYRLPDGRLVYVAKK